MATTSILDIDTLIQRETVRIDGTAYELRRHAELSLFELARLERTADKVQQQSAAVTEPTDEQRAEYEQLLARAVQVVLVAPADVLARLRTAHREAILWTFIGLSRPSLAPTRARHETATPTARAKTASRSARGSRASTAARRVSG